MSQAVTFYVGFGSHLLVFRRFETQLTQKVRANDVIFVEFVKKLRS